MDKFSAFIKKFEDSIYEEGTRLIFNVNFNKIPLYNYTLFN